MRDTRKRFKILRALRGRCDQFAELQIEYLRDDLLSIEKESKRLLSASR